ncbi:hypothetical protein [Myxococcus landrumensis]|uniref:Lipoprotein n=1 Tax=Myxococcus landrumensis TaxID=2813577 RepID=A0ABX7N5Z3_9BACT|nr:hypothetical protein [Myxococcus landrumus]QSQ12841.1 hypothetical protein JY572_31505 [Myxococcus landrumus]
MKTASLAVSTFAVALLGTGCSPECVDQFDCRSDNGDAPAGKEWVCRDEKCEAVPIVSPPLDDAGTPDAGQPDAGRPDSGQPDSGQPDSGPPDAGQPDAGEPDAGEPDAGPTDAGLPDAGEPDAGPTDAGEPDAGQPDAGEPTDGGPAPDAGVDCATTSYDPKLGTLQLQAGFVAAESVAMPDNVAALGSSPGPTYSIYAVQGSGKDAALYSLGTWPNLQPATTKLYDVVTPADRAGSAAVYAGGYVVNDGLRLLAGYTLGASGSPGSVAVYDFAMAANSTYISAPKNFTAASFSNGDVSAVLINGGGLGSLPTGLGIYGLVTSATPVATTRVANFPQGTVASGFTAVADNGVAALGLFNGDFVNVLYGVAPAPLSTAITTGTPLELAAQTPIDVGTDFNGAASFGSGVVVNRGAYDENYTFVSTDVSRFALSTGNNANTVTVGARTPVLVYPNQCTRVTMLEPLGSDVLVGVSDKNGRRLVRLTVAP